MKAAGALAIFTALAVAGVGLVRGTWAVGGSDSSCYALMADAFARGHLQPTTTLHDAPWPDAARTLAPGGFIPSPVRENASSPICSPGFSLLLAPLRAIGGQDAIFLLTPAAGALLVWFTFLFARHLAGPMAASAAAVAVATMPVFVFQVVQPMNDVVVAAAWMGVLVYAARPQDHSGAMGAVTGLAILIRPNLAPLAMVVAVWCAAKGTSRLLRFSVAAAPFIAVTAVLNMMLYGHPLQSGYGPATDLFAVGHVTQNAQNYTAALFRGQLGFPLLGLAAIFFVPRTHRRIVALPLALTAVTISIYLLYRPFPEWWYLRFLLPVLPMMIVLAMAALVFGARRTTIVFPVLIIVSAHAVASDEMRTAWDLQQLEGRFRSVGRVARERLPQNAVFVTVWPSGSIVYHASREVVLWDALAPTALDSAVNWLTSKGLEPFIVLEEWEEPAFRARFAEHSDLGDLDWPPRFQVDRQVRIFRPRDRAAYFAGEHVATEHVVSRPRR